MPVGKFSAFLLESANVAQIISTGVRDESVGPLIPFRFGALPDIEPKSQ